MSQSKEGGVRIISNEDYEKVLDLHLTQDQVDNLVKRLKGDLREQRTIEKNSELRRFRRILDVGDKVTFYNRKAKADETGTLLSIREHSISVIDEKGGRKSVRLSSIHQDSHIARME